MMERLTVKWTDKFYDTLDPVDILDNEYSKINYNKLLTKLGEYEDFEEIFRAKMTDTACEFLKDKEEFGKWLDRNKWITKKCDEWARAEEQGLLLRLPCKVGDILYVNGILGVGEAEKYKVIRVDYHSNLAMGRSEFYIEALLVSNPKNSIGFYDKEIGKTAFLTQAEAEAKLKELRCNHD